jgi:hypothetical protein
MTTLQNSYTVPMTLEEWVQCVPWLSEDELAHEIAKCAFVAFGDYTVATKPRDGMVMVSVPRFLDLMNDSIVPWRLEEVGFIHSVRGIYELNVNPHGHFTLEYCEGFVYVSAGRTSITTFTELLELIRMLTPPSND